MEYSILKQYDEISPYVNQVASIADKNKDPFGFLARSVYEQMAAKDQLWIVIDDLKELKAYLMFGGTMPSLKIFQVYVCPTLKRKGVGKMLIDNLKEYALERHYHTISARVAADLPANKFWEKIGFKIYRQEKGGEIKKRIINVRGYSIEDNHLFENSRREKSTPTPSRPVLTRPSYALDVNLLLDICKKRPGYEQVLNIMQMGFQGGLLICITPEFKLELERKAGSFIDDPALKLVNALPVLNASGDASILSESLRTIIFPNRSLDRKSIQNDESDLMHLAYCILSKVNGFLTREKALLRLSSEIKNRYGTSILSPDELLVDDQHTSNVLISLNSDFILEKSYNSSEVKSFLKDFSAPNFIIEKAFSESPIVESKPVYSAKFDESLFCVYFFEAPTKANNRATACLYVDENSPKAIAAIDHFIEKILRNRADFFYRLDLYIGNGQDITEDTLTKKGFIKNEGYFVKIMVNRFIDANNWAWFSEEVKSICSFNFPKKLPTKKELANTGIVFSDSMGLSVNLSWFDFETIISPRFIFNVDRNCVIVPIQENYAEGLIGNLTNQISLLDSHEQRLLLEKAYFRSSSKASIFSRGGIIAFYVSGSRSIQEIIGFARITYSDVISIDEAVIKLGRQGVLVRSELMKFVSPNDDKLHVFTFDNFLAFPNRISFSKAKRLGLISNANLVSPERIGSDKLKILISEAFNE